MQTAAPQQGTTGTGTTMDEILGDYYEHFDRWHPSGGFWGSLESFSRFLAGRRRFEGITASDILRRLREDEVLVEIPVNPESTSASAPKRVIKKPPTT